MKHSATICVLFVVAVVLTKLVGAADLFVRPGEGRGDGSREHPFRDPWLALDRANPGDVIHVAGGTYFGRLDCGNWSVSTPRLTILGGYSNDFSERNPWKNRSELQVYPDYTGARDAQLLVGQADHSGLVIDGLVIDGAGGNQYGEGPYGSLKAAEMAAELASFNSPDVIIRNCTFLNGQSGAVLLKGEGSRFENNIVVNHVGTYLLSLSPEQRDSHRPMVARGNTLMYSWSANAPATGGVQGVGIDVKGPAEIVSNIIVGCDNHGVSVFAPPERVSIQDNVFWMNGTSNVCTWSGTNPTLIDDAAMQNLEDLGLKKSDGNVVADPQLSSLDAGWVDAYSAWVRNHYHDPAEGELTALRTRAGLPEAVSTGSEPVDVFSPAYPAASAPLIAPETLKQGAHPLKLEVALSPSKPTPPSPTYTSVSWKAFAQGDTRLNGQRIELLVPTGNQRSFYLYDQIKEKDFVGFDILAPTEKDATEFGGQLMVYAPRGSSLVQHWDSSANFTSGAREHLFHVRGTAKSGAPSGGRQKLTLIVESIAPFEPPPVHKPRPAGHDLFVRAGSTGGDGSKAKPFKDPWQALEKAAAGDVIHVAGGDYFGKVGRGEWKFETQFVALLGGYNESFSERNPCTHRTRFAFHKTDANRHSGTYFTAEGNCQGLILDGFIFDGKDLNNYGSNGGLLRDPSMSHPIMVQLSGSGIAVRNCIFLNSAGPALLINGGEGTLENNVFVNNSEMAVRIALSGARAAPWIVRQNTMLFVYNPNPGAGLGESSTYGTMISTIGNGPIEIENNIIGFSDDFGVFLTSTPNDIKLIGNAMVLNLHAHFSDGAQILLDEPTWSRRSDDAGFKDCRENTFELPAIHIPKEYAQSYLTRASRLPSKFAHDRWQKFAASQGIAVAELAETAATAETPTSSSSPSPSSDLNSLLASLDRVKVKGTDKRPKDLGSFPAAFDLNDAMALVSQSKDAPIGAKVVELDAKAGQ
jgi:Right handed beta helix region